MEPFTRHAGRYVTFDRANVDTDAIIPARYLKRIERTGFGELLPDIQNTAGVPCEAYNNRACSLDGGTRTGTTKYCGGYKPGGTKAMLSVLPNTTLSIMSRGVEGEQHTSSNQENDPAALTSRPGNVMMNCSCQGGNGSCSVTSTDGKTSTCHKGEVDTCSGSCAYPKGTISGEQ